jgi:predicted  nucleic acid-binding Zn-ribbon protein
MHKALETLIALQEIDSQIIEKKKLLKEIPKKIEAIQKSIFQVEARVREIKSSIQTYEKKRRKKELELQEITEKIEKLKARTPEIKTNKEYQALLKEIEEAEKQKFLIEDDILYIMEELEEAKKKIDQQAQEAEKEKKVFIEEQMRVETQKAGIEDEIKELKRKRQDLIATIDKELYGKYMKLLEKGKGLAVAEAKDEVCLGCYMSIPPQLYVELRDNQDLRTCPQCGRFLYRK